MCQFSFNIYPAKQTFFLVLWSYRIYFVRSFVALWVYVTPEIFQFLFAETTFINPEFYIYNSSMRNIKYKWVYYSHIIYLSYTFIAYESQRKNYILKKNVYKIILYI